MPAFDWLAAYSLDLDRETEFGKWLVHSHGLSNDRTRTGVNTCPVVFPSMLCYH